MGAEMALQDLGVADMETGTPSSGPGESAGQ